MTAETRNGVAVATATPGSDGWPASRRRYTAVWTAHRPTVWPYGRLGSRLMLLTLANRKGGTGKSTAAVFLACQLARDGRS